MFDGTRIIKAIKNAKIPLIICLISFLIGILFSIFFTMSEDTLARCVSIFNIVTNEITITYYIWRFVCESIILVIVFTCGLTLYTMPLIYVLLAYRGFLTGLVIKSLIISYSIGGIAVTVFVVVPSALIALAAITCSCVLSCERLCGKRVIKCLNPQNLLMDFLFCLSVALASVIYILLIQVVFILPLNYSV